MTWNTIFRRGLSFRQAGGPTAPQMFGMTRLFGFSLTALLSPSPRAACGLLAAGFADTAIADRSMAERGEAPPFFAALRPPQAAIAITSLLVLATLCAQPAHGALQPGDRIAR